MDVHGRARRKAGDETRLQLMCVAERLFAQRGVDAVSLNEIVQAAKVNSAAIHYHFRTRERLIEAIIRERQPVWGERRLAMVRELEEREDVTAREVVTALVEPIAALKTHPWGDDYINFLGDVASHRRYAVILHTVGDHYTPPYLKQLARVTPHVPDHIRIARFAYAHEFLYHALAATDRRVAMWLQTIGESSAAWTTDDFIDLLTGALTAPVHESPSPQPPPSRSLKGKGE
jgi:AcrR family transcriptional regulator